MSCPATVEAAAAAYVPKAVPAFVIQPSTAGARPGIGVGSSSSNGPGGLVAGLIASLVNQNGSGDVAGAAGGSSSSSISAGGGDSGGGELVVSVEAAKYIIARAATQPAKLGPTLLRHGK